MKKHVIVLFVSLLSFIISAQCVTVSPSNGSALKVATLNEGKLIYNQETSSPNFYSGDSWIEIKTKLPFIEPSFDAKTNNLNLLK